MIRKHISYTLLFPLVISAVFFQVSCSGKADTQTGPDANDTLSVLYNLDLLIRENPDNPEYYFQRAKYHLEEENVYSGSADILKAIQLDSLNADYYVVLSQFNFLLKKVAETKANLETAMRLDPENVDARLRYAEFQLYLKDYPKVFENVNTALRLDKYSAKGYFIKGMAYLEMLDTNLAISSFQTTVEIDPEYYHAFMQLGILNAARKNELCVSYYNNAIKVNPGMPEAYYGLGYYYQETGRYNEALSTYDAMLKIAPDNAAAWYNKGFIQLLYTNNPDGAITCFSQAITYEPRYADAYYNRGYAYELKKNKEAAEKDYRNALNIDPENQLAKSGLKRLGK